MAFYLKLFSGKNLHNDHDIPLKMRKRKRFFGRIIACIIFTGYSKAPDKTVKVKCSHRVNIQHLV